jgi:hypothetical protein
MKVFFAPQTSRPNVFKFIMNSNILHKKGHMCWDIKKSFYMLILDGGSQ